ncbi:MAG: hypothetical protein D6683_13490 [Actinomyces sp.]|nr:MAG: hypothetical protein D6683_13490 [Actinomyces sp.]
MRRRVRRPRRPVRRTSRPVRPVVAGLALAVFAAACAADTPTASSSAGGDAATPTVPSVTEPAESIPSDTGPSETTPPTSGATPTTEPEPATTSVTAAPTGDLEAASVALVALGELSQPVALVVAPDGRWWIAERTGRVVAVDPVAPSAVSGAETPADATLGTGGDGPEVVLDIGDRTRAEGERGLLGIARDDTWLYVDHTDLNGDTRVAAYRITGDGVDPDSRVELLHQPQPFANHNGGQVVIGPDGDLYVGLGDGGSGGDPLGSGQDPTTRLGSILRITPTPDDPVRPWRVPPTNPWASGIGPDGSEGLPEIHLIGVRNPWRFSFDRATGDLWVADVGQNRWEEVTLLLAANAVDGSAGSATNLGWNIREGLHPFTDRPQSDPPADDPPLGSLTDPVWEYGHDRGCSVTGGYVYRGSAIPDLVGAYVFGDFCTARLWAVSTAGGVVTFRDLDVDVPGGRLAGFGETADGELVVFSLAGPVSLLVDAG